MVFRAAALIALTTAIAACSAPGDVTSVPGQAAVGCSEKLAGAAQSFQLDVAAADARSIPMTVFHPASSGKYPVVAFSHGAFATPGRYIAMLGPLAAAGYVVIAPMHVDSEEFGRETPPSREETWSTRNEDYALSLSVPAEVAQGLAQNGISVDASKRIAMGHSYGALIAQLTGGAIAIDPDSSRISRLDPEVDVIVAWSPPGAVPTMMDAEGWNSVAVPSLTITGTGDILPGFVDDWRAHAASYENAPRGGRALWVGEGVDHYFGGVFGRVKAADENSQVMFERALSQSLAFIEGNLDLDRPCMAGAVIEGESYDAD